MSIERDRLTDRRDLVQRDIEELAEQIADGEVDEATGDRLMAGYKQELAAAEAALAELPSRKSPKAPKVAAKDQVATDQGAPASGRSMSRVVVGAVLVATTVVVAVFLVARNTTPDRPGGASAAGPGELTVDPDSVSNEQLEAVVAANPDVPAMRLALANRYYRAGEFPQAMEHYLIIAESDLAPADETLVLARMGWIMHNIGHYEDAAALVTQSLALDSSNIEAQLYQGFITLYGLNDPGQAIPQLELALQIPSLSEPVVADLERALEEARQRLEP